MSTGDRIPYKEAMAAAALFIANFGITCERIEVAGSLRRYATNPRRPRHADVGDIEFVAIPKIAGLSINLFWQRMELLKYKLWEGRYQTNGNTYVRCGPKFRKYHIPSATDPQRTFPCDIWLADRANFGYIYALRTGPDTFNKVFVSPPRYGGKKPADITLDGGRVYLHTKGVPEGKVEWQVPEEINFFRALGIEWIPPYQRGVVEPVAIKDDEEEAAMIAAEAAA